MSKEELLNPEVIRQEEEYLQKVHPTPEDVPGCMKLFDDFLLCNGESLPSALACSCLREARSTSERALTAVVYFIVISSQARSLWRYGEMATCAPKLEEFKFCMSLKGVHPEEKRALWIRRRAEWWARRRAGRSSEDVWDVRTEPLQNFPPRRLDPDMPAPRTIN